jgi:hypothetical protein
MNATFVSARYSLLFEKISIPVRQTGRDGTWESFGTVRIRWLLSFGLRC